MSSRDSVVQFRRLLGFTGERGWLQQSSEGFLGERFAGGKSAGDDATGIVPTACVCSLTTDYRDVSGSKGLISVLVGFVEDPVGIFCNPPISTEAVVRKTPAYAVAVFFEMKRFWSWGNSVWSSLPNRTPF